jgi:hypothetical protein
MIHVKQTALKCDWFVSRETLLAGLYLTHDAVLPIK